MDGQVSVLGTVHPLLTISFLRTWILPLHVVSSTLKRKSSSSAMDGLQSGSSKEITGLHVTTGLHVNIEIPVIFGCTYYYLPTRQH